MYMYICIYYTYVYIYIYIYSIGDPAVELHAPESQHDHAHGGARGQGGHADLRRVSCCITLRVSYCAAS